MSWETMSSETKPCNCGRGTVTYERQMDDWNRVRKLRTINCDICSEAEGKRHDKARKAKEQFDHLTLEAFCLAEQRYFPKWVDQYSGKSKKEIWRHLIGDGTYPTLPTFYKHVGDCGGLSNYLASYFRTHFDKILARMDIDDDEVKTLLLQRPTVNSDDLHAVDSQPLRWYD